MPVSKSRRQNANTTEVEVLAYSANPPIFYFTGATTLEEAKQKAEAKYPGIKFKYNVSDSLESHKKAIRSAIS